MIPAAAGALIGSAGAGLTVRLPFERPPLSVGYAVDQHLGELYPGTPDLIHHFTASIETSCRCAGVQVALDLPSVAGALRAPSLRFVLDLKQLGSFGSP